MADFTQTEFDKLGYTAMDAIETLMQNHNLKSATFSAITINDGNGNEIAIKVTANRKTTNNGNQ